MNTIPANAALLLHLRASRFFMKPMVTQCISPDLCDRESYLINIDRFDVPQESGAKSTERNVIGNVKTYRELVLAI